MKSYLLSGGIHRVSGRGEVYVVNIPSNDPLPEIGEIVQIDGIERTVTGIEYSNGLTAPPIRLPQVGLIFEE